MLVNLQEQNIKRLPIEGGGLGFAIARLGEGLRDLLHGKSGECTQKGVLHQIQSLTCRERRTGEAGKVTFAKETS